MELSGAIKESICDSPLALLKLQQKCYVHCIHLAWEWVRSETLSGSFTEVITSLKQYLLLNKHLPLNE